MGPGWLQGGNPSSLWGGLQRAGSAQRGTAAPLTIATWAPCGQIFWFQGSRQLDFIVKLWDFKYWQFLFFSLPADLVWPACCCGFRG